MKGSLRRIASFFLGRIQRRFVFAIETSDLAARVRQIQSTSDDVKSIVEGANNSIGNLNGAVEAMNSNIGRILDFQATERQALRETVGAANDEIHLMRAELDSIREILSSLRSAMERVEQREEFGRDDILAALAPVEARIIGLGRRLDGMGPSSSAPH